MSRDNLILLPFFSSAHFLLFLDVDSESKTVYPSRLYERFSSNFPEVLLDQKTPEKLQTAQGPKCCENSYPNVNNINNNSSSQKIQREHVYFIFKYIYFIYVNNSD